MSSGEKLAHAILLFLRGGRWTKNDHTQWQELTGNPIASVQTINNMARRIIEDAELERKKEQLIISPNK